MSVEPWAESELKGKDIIKESSIFIYCKFIFSFKLPYVVTLSTKGIKMIFKCQSIQSFNLSHHPPGANPWSFEDWCPTQNAPPIFLVRWPWLSTHWPVDILTLFFLTIWSQKWNFFLKHLRSLRCNSCLLLERLVTFSQATFKFPTPPPPPSSATEDSQGFGLIGALRWWQ